MTDKPSVEGSMAIFDLVKLRPSIILDHLELSPQDLARLRSTRELPVPDPRRRELELELGGVVVARGRMVQRGGATWFKITEMTGGKP